MVKTCTVIGHDVHFHFLQCHYEIGPRVVVVVQDHGAVVKDVCGNSSRALRAGSSLEKGQLQQISDLESNAVHYDVSEDFGSNLLQKQNTAELRQLAL
eukprot:5669817-Amphidinium_carterae.1